MAPSQTIDDLLDRWEEAFEAGREIPVAELARDHPHLISELASCIEALKRFAAAPTKDFDSSHETLPVPEFPGFEIEGLLGKGGMGVVYRARQPELDRTVALKVLRSPGPFSSPQIARLRQEAAIVGRLQHPHIVQIFGVIEHNRQVALVLEYLPGGSLAQAISRERISPHESARLVATLASAMDAAHRAGVVHRDLKPGNVLLGTNDRNVTADGSSFLPKVADFGLAKLFDESAGGPTMTQSGAIVGTPSYMAPEQATGRKRIGPAADIYALGAILYEMLAGRPPFLGDSTFSTLKQVTDSDPVSPRSLRSDVPRDLETICLKCLEKEPSQRYASAAALADDLGDSFGTSL